MRRLMAAIGGTLACLVMLELSLRVFGAFLPGTYRVGSLVEPDLDLGWRHVRSDTYASRSSEWNVRLALNAEGRRGELTSRSAGARRVVLYGDSFVEGAQVDDARTVSAQVRAALQASDVEVLNDGVSGYGTDQQLLAYERSPVRVDVAVIVLAVSNDIWNNHEPLESLRPTTVKPFFRVGPDGALEQRPSPPMPIWDRLRLVSARSAALSMLKSAFAPDRPAPDLRRTQLAVLEVPTAQWAAAYETTEAILTRFASGARTAGAVPVLVLAPDGCQVHKDLCGDEQDLSGSRIPQDRLLAHSARIGLQAVDLLPAFRAEAERGTRLYFRRDLHWNAAGHALAGAAIAAAVRPALDRLR